MTESELYQKYIKKWLGKRGVFHYRVEHARLPDIYSSKGGKCLWFELKVIECKSDIISPQWRPGQLSWIHEHNRFNPTESIMLILWYLDDWYVLQPKETYELNELEGKNGRYFQ